MIEPSVLDHIVINTRFEMDRAQNVFSKLGFTLTPRGFHTLGSINHLMMFADDYLELVGLPGESGERRADLANAPVGLNGLVFKSDNIDATYAHLRSVGLAGDPPRSFSRPVALADGSMRDARFRTVAVRPGAFAAGRLYFCEHLTPELLWRSEWQSHANGVTGFREVLMVAEEPDAQASLVCLASGIVRTGPDAAGDLVIGLSAKTVLRIQTPKAYSARFGDLGQAAPGRAAILAGISFSRGEGIPVAIGPGQGLLRHGKTAEGTIVVSLADLKSVLIFERGNRTV